ncbi:hypothetical protein HD554DRAFT_12627 [Boletus coccyginus]|nr:hypothetical protein HD554DRAFT_12627 [Boletus coccyginus]
MQSLISPASSERCKALPESLLHCRRRRHRDLCASYNHHVRFIPAHERESDCLADPAWRANTDTFLALRGAVIVPVDPVLPLEAVRAMASKNHAGPSPNICREGRTFRIPREMASYMRPGRCFEGSPRALYRIARLDLVYELPWFDTSHVAMLSPTPTSIPDHCPSSTQMFHIVLCVPMTYEDSAPRVYSFPSTSASTPPFHRSFLSDEA